MSSSAPRPPLPQPPTPFIGRQREIRELDRRLADPDCRLLTLLGPGGVGKTRLAIEAATRWRDAGGDAVFVDLQPVQATGLLVTAVADALDPALASRENPRAHLLRYLGDCETLIVLDNFEHLTRGAGLLGEMLQAGPGVKLLVTSRVVLGLREEWLFSAEGLRFPDATARAQVAAAELAGYDAVRLFAASAQRVQPDFALAPAAADVARVCAVVEGLPLAIELAAAWTKMMSPAAIADEIERDLSFLASPLRNMPAKHRNMAVVFQRSWELLAAEEQEVFQRLAVFQGGFDRDAAAQVAGAALPVLSAMVDNSLLRWRADGRYSIHELLRQWGAAQLAQTDDAGADSRDRHAAYYARFLGDRFDDLTSARQLAALTEVAGELDNVRAAWQWACTRQRVADLERGAMALHTFYQYRGRFLEGMEAFAQAVAAVESVPAGRERDRALALLLTCAGWLEMRFGRTAAAMAKQEKALALYDAHGLLPVPGQGTDPLTALALLAATAGNYEDAVRHGKAAWERATARADKKNLAFAGYGLASVTLAQGDYEEALYYAHEALALSKAAGNRWLMAYLHIQLGQINQILGNTAAAAEYFQASYEQRKELGDPEGMALALSFRGEVLLAEGAYRQASALFAESRSLYDKLGDRGGLVRAYHGLGAAAAGMGDDVRACEQLAQALRIAARAQAAPLTLSLLVTVGRFLAERGERAQGLATLGVVLHHPASEEGARDAARALLRDDGVDDSGALPSPPGWPDAAADPARAHLDTVIMTLLATLSALAEQPRPLPAVGGETAAPGAQPLVEPLTEREVEVLQHLAVGRTNQEIAQALMVAVSTVKSHNKSIYGKLGVSNRAEAGARARELGLLQ